MDEIFVEHIVKRKLGVKELLFRILSIFVTVLIFFVGIYYLHMLGITITILIGYLAYLVFVYTSIEYEYALVNGDLSVDKIMGQRKRRFAGEFEFKNAELIAPTFSEDVLAKDFTKTYDFSSGHRNHSLYSMILSDKGGMIQVVFEPNEKMLDAMHRIKPSIVKID